LPEGPAGVIAIVVAWTAPAESRVPLARRHSPVCKSVEDADDIRVTVAVVGTLITWVPEVAVSTVIDVPLAWVTSPVTTGIAG
jgi:anti-sigma factor RsiW